MNHVLHNLLVVCKLSFHHRLKPVESRHRELRTEVLRSRMNVFRLRLLVIHVNHRTLFENSNELYKNSPDECKT